jgi:hypothetical protein
MKNIFIMLRPGEYISFIGLCLYNVSTVDMKYNFSKTYTLSHLKLLSYPFR